MSRPARSSFDLPPGLEGIQRLRLADTFPPVAPQDRRIFNSVHAPSAATDGMQRPYTIAEQRDSVAYGNGLHRIGGRNGHNSPPLPQLASTPPPSTFTQMNRRGGSPPQATPYPDSSPPSNRNSMAFTNIQAMPSSGNTSLLTSPKTLSWSELEPWMDEEYVKQVCSLMGWDQVNITIPRPAADPNTGQQANNPGYCLVTFPSSAHAGLVLSQINNGGAGGKGLSMPNSSKPFVMNWAPLAQATSPSTTTTFPSHIMHRPVAPVQPQPFQEYSIFVGDLAPETSNSDLVAVFRNPVLGLRNDREPKFIRPFLSCKSAKIMLDPITGVSRGYGFVRFTDEADQQRALIEMHGLYCLSRPMRISPATAKYKPPAPAPSFDAPYVPPTYSNGDGVAQSVAAPLPAPVTGQTKSVSAPFAAPTNAASTSTSGSPHFFGPGTPPTMEERLNDLPPSVLAQLAQQYSGNTKEASNVGGGASNFQEEELQRALAAHLNREASPRFVVSDETMKHTAQARAILGNLIGPNGEQLTSTDPYNTTVFVGGLSPLISEDTLRTFFAPFGDIHYVKVPVGKHCGFVQFVRKSDAEKAIEKMQGFPIGGSRIRLSWGRSQYKAAQAAAQAAQNASLQIAYSPSANIPNITPELAWQILQKVPGYDNREIEKSVLPNGSPYSQNISQSSFSPFAGDNSVLHTSSPEFVPMRRDIPYPSKSYSPGFQNSNFGAVGSGKASPPFVSG